MDLAYEGFFLTRVTHVFSSGEGELIKFIV